MKRKAGVIFSIFVPGLGQLLLGRPIRGALFLLGVGLCFDAALFARFRIEMLPHVRTALTWGPLAIGALVWLYAIADAIRLARPDAREVAERRERHFRQGLIHFLRDELAQAEAEFTHAIELDSDDVDARFHLALTLKARNELKRARRAFRQCRELDEDRKWSREIEQELREIERSAG